MPSKLVSSRSAPRGVVHAVLLLITVAAHVASGCGNGSMQHDSTGGAGSGAPPPASGAGSSSDAGHTSAAGSGPAAGDSHAGTSGRAISNAGASQSGAGAGASGTSGVSGGGATSGAAADSGASGAGSSGNGSTAPALVLPIERDGKYVFEFGDTLFEIDPMIGGRIVKCQVEGHNLVTGPEIDPLNYGATFWPSPQQRWDWPPVPEIDSQPYTATISNTTVTLQSTVGQRAKVAVTKRFTPHPNEHLLEVEYELANRDTVAVSWAAWEVTRVAAGGLSFFPSGTTTVTSQLPVVTMSGTTWYQHDPSKVGMGQKFSGDGKEGWLAHVAGDAILVKTFEDVAPAMQAPAPEAEIALYAAAGYVELEPQGPYTEIMPNQSVHWTVRWHVQKLQAGANTSLGSQSLVDYARSIAAASR